MRLIDADALIEKWYEVNNIGPEDRGARFIGYTEIPRFINNAPTVELIGDLISKADAICEVLVNDGIDNIVDRINALPSADAVEVVRCKDCKHQEKFCFDDSKVLCWVHDIDIVVSPTDYCSYAERRAESEVKE